MQNAKMSEYKDRQSSVYPGLSMHQREEEEQWNYWTGIVKHEYGVVTFSQYIEYSDTGVKHKNLMISVIHKGRAYDRHWDAWYGEKTIARLANEFIEEIKGEGS